MKYALFAAVVAIPAAALAFSARIGTTPSGDVLQAPDGRTLYVYDGDKIDQGQEGRSSCNEGCADRWPPFPAAAAKATGDWGIISREDGTRRWTYKRRPLYTWARDTGPNQINGNGYEGNS